MTSIKQILCPVDLSETSRHAALHAATIARWYGAQVTVLHVTVPFLPPIALPPYPGGASLSQLPPAADPREDLRQFCQSIDVPGFSPTLALEEGGPVQVISRVADAWKPDLLVMGTHGRGGFQRLLLGSVTEKVLRLVSCPVLTIPPRSAVEATPSFRTILCAIDFGPSALRALDHAFALARQTEARIVLLHVVEPLAERFAMAEPVGVSVPDLQRSILEAASERLTGLIPADARSWCRPEARVTTGNPHREILRVAIDELVDVIVMGVQGRGAVDLLLFGSTTHHVVREAVVPVLTLRAAHS